MTKEIKEVNNLNRQFDNNDSWKEWSRHVFSELERLGNFSEKQQEEQSTINSRLSIIETKLENFASILKEYKNNVQENNDNVNKRLDTVIEKITSCLSKIENMDEEVEDLYATTLSLNNVISGEGENPGLKTRVVVLEDNQKKIQRIVFGAVVSIVTSAISAVAYVLNIKFL